HTPIELLLRGRLEQEVPVILANRDAHSLQSLVRMKLWVCGEAWFIEQGIEYTYCIPILDGS
ncbi:hypothetical protein ABER50_12175, partial [Cutibacterium acnes]